MNQLLKTKEIIHYPNLQTVLMVEDFVKEHSGEFKKRPLWENLPRKIMYQTYCVIFDYLIDSGKIAVDKEGTIGWTWNPELIKQFQSKSHLRIK